MTQSNIAVLNVAEKPSVARSLAAAFSRMPQSTERGMERDRDSGHQIFRHDSVMFPLLLSQAQQDQGHRQLQNFNRGGGPPSPHKMITTSIRGHLASIEFEPQYGWSRCDPSALFDAPIETIYKDDMQPLYKMLKRLARNVQAVILWLDCDREGEAIGAEVQEVCLEGNPRLRPYVYRARFSTVLDAEIRRALYGLSRLNDSFVQAVQARSQIDLRIGACFTRFQTMRLQKKFQMGESVISYGPCQFPTLGFVVERWARIMTFVAEDFWYLELKLTIPNNAAEASGDTAHPAPPTQHRLNPGRVGSCSNRPIIFTWKRARLYDRLMTLALYESCLDAGVAVVTHLSGRPKNKWRPVPLATVELQKRASKYLRIGSETLMAAAEELYQQGYISYPRTETERFRPEFQHRSLIQDLANVSGGPFSEYANKLLNGAFQNPRAGPNDDQAHPPITPCKAVDPTSIADQTQRGIYTLIVKHYLACCSPDANGRETSITVKMAGEEFTAKGLMVLEKNWLEIYEPWERWSTGQGELPRVELGSRILPSSLMMREGRTTPPDPISEVELISLMDRNKIGTDATIAQHISTIQDREYAIKDPSQRFLPTPLGIALVEGYNSMGYQLNKPDLRREMERECNLVAEGLKRKDDIIGPILAKMRQCFNTARAEGHKLDQAVARHFQRLGVGNDTTVLQARFSECGMCHSLMSLKQERRSRQGNNSNGYGNRFPRKLLFCNTCQIGYGLPKGKHRPKTEQENSGPAVRCPICQFQVIRIVRGDGYEGNGYHVCPKCFSDAPPEHGGVGHGSDFRCFSCTHPTCSLAGGTPGGDVEVFACPFCRQLGKSGKVSLRNTSRGYVLSCSNYSGQNRCAYTIWLPRESNSVSVPDGGDNICQHCSSEEGPVRKVSFVWKPGSVPPHLGRSLTVCILCDVAFRSDLRLSLPRLNQVLANPRRRTGGGGQSGSNSRGNSGGRGARVAPAPPFNRANTSARQNGRNLCFKCGQPGHFASSCPNK